MKKYIKLLSTLLICHLVSACASAPEEVKEMPLSVLYNKAMDAFEQNDYKNAVKYFDEVERQYPYSPWAINAQIMGAYTHYKNAEYTDAVLVLNRFLELHPGNKYAPYALYLKGMSYYEQISDITRDQKMTNLARDTFSRLAILYPNTDYAKDAKGKIILTKNHLAGKEMAVGRYYMKTKRYLAAANRFAEVVRSHQTSMHTPEALYRLSSCYLALGLKEDAKRTAAVLGHNYPDSKWYKKAYVLLTENGVK